MAMKFRDCFQFMAQRWTDELVITSAGNSGQMWWDVTHDMERTFYLDASMSLSTLFASGIALGLPGQQVWAFMGDGAFCMNPGMLLVERKLDLPNLTHFLVSNRGYGATSNAQLPNDAVIDYPAVARSFGLERVFNFDSLDGLQAGFDGAVHANAPGHTFVVLELEPLDEVESQLEVPPMDGPEMKFRFGRHVESGTGCKIFSHQI